MGKKERPYIGYNEEEVKKMEDGYFLLQFGGDFILEDSFYLFTKAEAHKIYNKTLRDLIGLIKDGSEKDKKFAIDLIGGLQIRPMRLH